MVPYLNHAPCFLDDYTVAKVMIIIWNSHSF